MSSSGTYTTSTRCRTPIGIRSRMTRLTATRYGPRNLVHTWATDTDDPTEQPRWGKIGKQRIVDEGPLAPYPDMSNVPNMHDITPKAKYDMGTFDEVLVKASMRLHGQGQDGRQAVLRLAQHDAHARLDVSVAQVPGAHEQRDQLRSRGSRHGANG